MLRTLSVPYRQVVQERTCYLGFVSGKVWRVEVVTIPNDFRLVGKHPERITFVHDDKDALDDDLGTTWRTLLAQRESPLCRFGPKTEYDVGRSSGERMNF